MLLLAQYKAVVCYKKCDNVLSSVATQKVQAVFWGMFWLEYASSSPDQLTIECDAVNK